MEVEMRLIRVIKRFFRSEDFCYPMDFFWINTDVLKETWKARRFKTIISVLTYYIVSIIACAGYYLLLPFRLLHEWFESWCYYL